MASIVKRGKAYAVVYYEGEGKNKHQVWESGLSYNAAKSRKAQLEYEVSQNIHIEQNDMTVSEFLHEFVQKYGEKRWVASTYDGNVGLLENYVYPYLGDKKLRSIRTKTVDDYYHFLLFEAEPVTNPGKPKREHLTTSIIHDIHKVLRCAFNQAVKWEMISRNPVLNATLPKCETKPREIWTADTLFHALELCDDDNLALALNLAFSCSLRMGEMLALTWDCIDISAESISHDCASIFVNKELQRVQKQSLEMLDGKGVIKVFPSILVSKHTALVLKEPKTKTSIRKVFLPKTVAEMLLKRQAEQNELKELFGDEYTDYGLVFCSPMGTPIEGQVINRALNKLIEDNGLPKVVFHSLRHSSITYKLKLNGGDMKSVQGDSGHAQLKMVADVYSHIIDEDRRLNAKRFEDAFYSGHKTEDELDGLHARSIEQAAAPQPAEPETDQQLLLKLLNNPEMAALLKTLAKSL